VPDRVGAPRRAGVQQEHQQASEFDRRRGRRLHLLLLDRGPGCIGPRPCVLIAPADRKSGPRRIAATPSARPDLATRPIGKHVTERLSMLGVLRGFCCCVPIFVAESCRSIPAGWAWISTTVTIAFMRLCGNSCYHNDCASWSADPLSLLQATLAVRWTKKKISSLGGDGCTFAMAAICAFDDESTVADSLIMRPPYILASASVHDPRLQGMQRIDRQLAVLDQLIDRRGVCRWGSPQSRTPLSISRRAKQHPSRPFGSRISRLFCDSKTYTYCPALLGRSPGPQPDSPAFPGIGAGAALPPVVHCLGILTGSSMFLRPAGVRFLGAGQSSRLNIPKAGVAPQECLRRSIDPIGQVWPPSCQPTPRT